MSTRQLAMVIDLNKCIGCQTCTLACKSQWTDRGGVVFATTHTTDDVGCVARTRAPGDWQIIEPGSFRLPDGNVRTYLVPGELVTSFAPLEVVDSWEGLGPEHRHGDGPPERHAIARAVFRKP